MRVTVNGESVEVVAGSLAELLAELDYGAHVATAVNGEFVPRTHREAQSVESGDRIEVLAPMQGG